MREIWFLCLAATLFFLASVEVRAESAQDLQALLNNAPSDSVVAPDTNIGGGKIIRLTPDKTHIVRLEQDASSVIVTNPKHASIVLDSPRLLVLMPHDPGATNFTVLNAKGEVIMEKSVIVSAVEQNYVRIRRICGRSDSSCVPVAYFYCPDSCYEVAAVPYRASSTPPIIGGGGGGGGGGGSSKEDDDQASAEEDMLKAYGEGVGQGLSKQEMKEDMMKAYGEGVGQGIGKTLAPPPSSTNQNLNTEAQ